MHRGKQIKLYLIFSVPISVFFVSSVAPPECQVKCHIQFSKRHIRKLNRRVLALEIFELPVA